jgi:hypothetical protein
MKDSSRDKTHLNRNPSLKHIIINNTHRKTIPAIPEKFHCKRETSQKDKNDNKYPSLSKEKCQ